MKNYIQDWQDDCKLAKKIGMKAKTYDEYVQYRQGNYKPKLRGTPMPVYKVSQSRYPAVYINHHTPAILHHPSYIVSVVHINPHRHPSSIITHHHPTSSTIIHHQPS